MVYPPREEEREQERREAAPALPNESMKAEIERKIDYTYPYAALHGVQAKVAASDLASREFSAQYAVSSRPAFLSEKGLTPAERGTALHAFMQFADYRKAAADPAGELGRLVERGFLTVEQGGAVEIEKVRAFFSGPVARRILASPRVLREYRFTVEIPAGTVQPELTGKLAEQPVVLQGAVDCAFEENGKLVLVDYKTDRAKDPAELWQRYRAQLALYRLALEQCTGLQVGECLLYSFYLNAAIENSSLTNGGNADKINL